MKCKRTTICFMISINLVTNGDLYPIDDLQFSVAFIIAQVWFLKIEMRK